jgi:hypothetical protein
MQVHLNPTHFVFMPGCSRALLSTLLNPLLWNHSYKQCSQPEVISSPLLLPHISGCHWASCTDAANCPIMHKSTTSPFLKANTILPHLSTAMRLGHLMWIKGALYSLDTPSVNIMNALEAGLQNCPHFHVVTATSCYEIREYELSW